MGSVGRMNAVDRCDECAVELGENAHIHIMTCIATGEEATVCSWCFGDGWEGWRHDEESDNEE